MSSDNQLRDGEWKSYLLNDILQTPLRNGVNKPSKVRGVGYKMVNMGELFANPIIRDIDMERVPMSDSELKNSLLEKGDLLFARQSLTVEGAGKCSLFLGDGEPTTFEGHLIRVRLNRELASSRYLYYYFQSHLGMSQIRSIVTVTAAAGIRSSDLGNMEILLPPLSTQQCIASILSALDDKIELNRQTNATLETIAQAIFKAWFVDFEFPVLNYDSGDFMNTMMAGGENHSASPNQTNHSAEMVESELGLIPAGWRVSSLPEVIEVNPPRTLKRGEVAPYLDMANLPTQGHRAIEWVDRSYSSGTRFANGDTLLARITPCLENGKTAFVDFLADGQTGWGSTEFIVLRPKPPLPPEYGYFFARSENLRNHAIQNMIGTSGRQRTPTSSLGSFLIVVPSEQIASRFGKITSSITAQIRARDEESRTLAQIRDALLPRLMRGEVVV